MGNVGLVVPAISTIRSKFSERNAIGEVSCGMILFLDTGDVRLFSSGSCRSGERACRHATPQNANIEQQQFAKIATVRTTVFATRPEVNKPVLPPSLVVDTIRKRCDVRYMDAMFSPRCSPLFRG